MHLSRLPDPLPEDPLPLAAGWLEAATAQPVGRNPNAMALATVDGDGRPSVRIVLCKGFVTSPGYLVFYTNYTSRKGRELDRSGRAAAVMYWDELGRQIRVEGPVRRSPAAESDGYFAARPWQSQLAARASEQSRPIGTQTALLEQLHRAAREFGVEPLQDGALPERAAPPRPIPRPAHWGGYRLWIEAIELWVEGAARLHERARWLRALDPAAEGFHCGPWQVSRLQP